MVKTFDDKIDGRRVVIVQFAARRSLFLKTKLLRLLGAPLLKMLGSAKGASVKSIKAKMEADMDFTEVAMGFEMLTSKLSEDEFFELVLEILSSTKVMCGQNFLDVNKDNFDIIFEDGLVFTYKLLWKALSFNYSDFFGKGGIGSLLAKLDTKTPTPPESQQA